MNRIIRRLLNKIRKMDGRRPMLAAAGVLAVLVTGVMLSGGGRLRIAGVSLAGGMRGEERIHDSGEEVPREESTLAEGDEDAERSKDSEGFDEEPVRLPVGQFLFVRLEEYGTDLPYYDAEGKELGRLHQGDEIEVLPWDGDTAPFYYNDECDVAYVEARYLVEEEPGRLIRPAIEPSLTPEEAGEVSIRIYKERRELELLSDGEVIATYSIGLGGWPWETKNVKGDSRTPEGSYYICVRNANSRFHRALGISYPNQEDAKRGYENGVITKKQKNEIDKAIDAGQKPPWNTNLGGEIMIHGASEDGIGAGRDWTAGCIAVEDAVIDILWEYGKMGTEVVIEP